MSENTKKGSSLGNTGGKNNSTNKGQNRQVRTFSKESGASAQKGISSDVRIAKPKK